MDDNSNTDDAGNLRGREALMVLLAVLFGGAALIGAVDHIHHLGPTWGNALFAALPLIAILVAASRLHNR